MVEQKREKGSWIPDDYEATIPVLNFFCLRAISMYLIHHLLFGFSVTCNLAWPKGKVALSSYQERNQQKDRMMRVLPGDCWGGHCQDTRGQVLRTSLGKDGLLSDEGRDNRAGTTPLTLTGSTLGLAVTNHLNGLSSSHFLLALPSQP